MSSWVLKAPFSLEENCCDEGWTQRKLNSGCETVLYCSQITLHLWQRTACRYHNNLSTNANTLPLLLTLALCCCGLKNLNKSLWHPCYMRTSTFSHFLVMFDAWRIFQVITLHTDPWNASEIDFWRKKKIPLLSWDIMHWFWCVMNRWVSLW